MSEAVRFQVTWHMKVVSLSALRTRRLYPQEIFLVLSQPQSHTAAGRIMSMKNFIDTIGNRTRDLPACRAMPQPTAPPAACPTQSFGELKTFTVVRERASFI